MSSRDILKTSEEKHYIIMENSEMSEGLIL